MLDQNDKTYFDVSGALMYDPCIGDCGIAQIYLPGKDFVLNNQCILNFNQSLLSEMIDLSASCGLDAVSTHWRWKLHEILSFRSHG